MEVQADALCTDCLKRAFFPVFCLKCAIILGLIYSIGDDLSSELKTGKQFLKDEIKLIFLGGHGEIGRNCLLLESSDQILMVDCGLRFPYALEYPGIDFIIPDFSYLESSTKPLIGVILTHGHEDHIGALSFMFRQTGARVPVYGTKFTLGMAAGRMGEAGVLSQAELIEVAAGEKRQIGAFEVEFFHVCHSIAAGLGLVLNTSAGSIVHSGDFKFDAHPIDGRCIDEKRLKELGRAGVRLLLADSTNVQHSGFALSESEVGPGLRRVFEGAPGRVLVTCFASHVHRFAQILKQAHAVGRKVATLGRSMDENMQLAFRCGELEVPPDTWIDFDEMVRKKPSNTVLVVTGSQGEFRSGLHRLAAGEVKALKLAEGDRFVYSARMIPGNERPISNLFNRICDRGVEICDSRENTLHVSGHGHREDCRRMLELLNPEYFVPMHGETRHQISFRQLALEQGLDGDHVFVLRDGMSLKLGKGKPVSADEDIPAGDVLVEGVEIWPDEEPVLRDRRHLHSNGTVVCLLMVSKLKGKIVLGPELTVRGIFAGQQPQEGELDQLFHQIRSRFKEDKPELEQTELGHFVTRVIRRYFKDHYSKRPVVIPVIVLS